MSRNVHPLWVIYEESSSFLCVFPQVLLSGNSCGIKIHSHRSGSLHLSWFLSLCGQRFPTCARDEKESFRLVESWRSVCRRESTERSTEVPPSLTSGTYPWIFVVGIVTLVCASNKRGVGSNLSVYFTTVVYFLERTTCVTKVRIVGVLRLSVRSTTFDSSGPLYWCTKEINTFLPFLPEDDRCPTDLCSRCPFGIF